MARKLITMPARAGLGALRLTTSLTIRAVRLAASSLPLPGGQDRREAERFEAQVRADADARRPAAASTPPAPPPPPAAASTPSAPSPPATGSPPPPASPAVSSPAAAAEPEPEPPTPITDAEAARKTVDDEPTLVAEFADPGVADGAGASIEIDPPWEDYARMNAGAIIERLAEADPAAVALVELYERAHKNRRTVLAAAERRLRSAAGRS